jgi:hypothetical protein
LSTDWRKMLNADAIAAAALASAWECREGF